MQRQKRTAASRHAKKKKGFASFALEGTRKAITSVKPTIKHNTKKKRRRNRLRGSQKTSPKIGQKQTAKTQN